MIQSYTDHFLLGLVEFFEWSKWLLLLAFCLTIGDLRFGISASKHRNEPIKRSRAIRRTVDKMCSYCLWVIMAYTFGQAFGNPFGIDLLPLIILLVIYGVELESIYVNYFAARGKKVTVNIFKLFTKKADIFEIEEKEEETKDEKKKEEPGK